MDRLRFGNWVRLEDWVYRRTPQGTWLPSMRDSWLVRQVQVDAIVLENGRTDHQLRIPFVDIMGMPTRGSDYWHPGSLRFRRRVMLSGYQTIIW